MSTDEQRSWPDPVVQYLPCGSGSLRARRAILEKGIEGRLGFTAAWEGQLGGVGRSAPLRVQYRADDNASGTERLTDAGGLSPADGIQIPLSRAIV
jgi:hypothetical protein